MHVWVPGSAPYWCEEKGRESVLEGKSGLRFGPDKPDKRGPHPSQMISWRWTCGAQSALPSGPDGPETQRKTRRGSSQGSWEKKACQWSLQAMASDAVKRPAHEDWERPLDMEHQGPRGSLQTWVLWHPGGAGRLRWVGEWLKVDRVGRVNREKKF